MKKRAKKDSFLTKYGYHIVFIIFFAVCFASLATILLRDKRKLTEIPVFDEQNIQTHNKNP